MNIPTIRGIIDRRILINFVADPLYVKRIIPTPFRPKIYDGKAIVGICLIRLKNIRPKGFPAFVGVNSENGAHRIAVEWEENGKTKSGVYIPRRDTSLRLNTWVGGRLFPGKHYLADFSVCEMNNRYQIDIVSSDNTEIMIDAEEGLQFNGNSIFKSLDAASSFFEKGDLGYSPNGRKFEGMHLKTNNWKIRPLKVNKVKSSFFEDELIFPKGSVVFDNALVMTNIPHEWHSAGNIKCV